MRKSQVHFSVILDRQSGNWARRNLFWSTQGNLSYELVGAWLSNPPILACSILFLSNIIHHRKLRFPQNVPFMSHGVSDRCLYTMHICKCDVTLCDHIFPLNLAQCSNDFTSTKNCMRKVFKWNVEQSLSLLKLLIYLGCHSGQAPQLHEWQHKARIKPRSRVGCWRRFSLQEYYQGLLGYTPVALSLPGLSNQYCILLKQLYRWTGITDSINVAIHLGKLIGKSQEVVEFAFLLCGNTSGTIALSLSVISLVHDVL